MPRGIPTIPLRTVQCPQCGVWFSPRTHRQVFCSPAHKDSFRLTEERRGREAVKFVMSWRKGKHGKNPNSSYALAQLCAMADLWLTEDRKLGRNVDLIVSRRRADGWLAVDL